MKKLKIAAAVAAALTTGVAGAYTVGQMSNGLLVPKVTLDANGGTTAVGLVTSGCGINPANPTLNGHPSAQVFWTYFDENSTHQTDGQFPMTDNDIHTFIWKDEAGSGFTDADSGYLVFTIDTDGDGAISAADSNCLGAEAFQVSSGGSNIEFRGTYPIFVPRDARDTGTATTGSIQNPTNMNGTVISRLTAGAKAGSAGFGAPQTLLMRYSIGGGDSTEITVWSADNINGTYTVNAYDDEENRKSVNFALPNKEQNTLDPSTIKGMPTNFTNGFIEWNLPDPATRDITTDPNNGDIGLDGNGVISDSKITSSTFSNSQTILNPHRNQ